MGFAAFHDNNGGLRVHVALLLLLMALAQLNAAECEAVARQAALIREQAEQAVAQAQQKVRNAWAAKLARGRWAEGNICAAAGHFSC